MPSAPHGECIYHRLSVFRRVRKVAKGDYYLCHVCPSVRVEQLGFLGTDFHENLYLRIFAKYVENRKSYCLNLTRIICTVHEDLYIYIYIYINIKVIIIIYTGCPRRNVPDFGRVFLMLNYTDITQNTYVRS